MTLQNFLFFACGALTGWIVFGAVRSCWIDRRDMRQQQPKTTEVPSGVCWWSDGKPKPMEDKV